MRTRSQLFGLTCLFAASALCAQVTEEYGALIQKAESFYAAKDYKNSAFTYSSAFRVNGWKAMQLDRYNAACSWAMAGYPDSAFFNLERIATLMNYQNYGHVSADGDLDVLHKDKRWEPFLEKVKENKEKAEANLNKPLVRQLDSIYSDDQSYRKKIDEVQKKYGMKSKEIQELWKTINLNDSINLLKVKAILDKYGWPGPDEVGNQGSTTIFLVIQHADLKTQQKYLPVMREAVKKGKAQGSSLALLEDRVAIREGKKQIYGSQIGMDMETNQYYVQPLDDPDNVDKRRAEVGLQPLAEYVKHWDMKWNVEQYKKDLPKIEEKEKNRK